MTPILGEGPAEMTIHEDRPELLDYVNAKLHARASKHPDPQTQSFLECFLWACLRADGDNFILLRPVLLAIQAKYPASEERLAMERRDRGAA